MAEYFALVVFGLLVAVAGLVLLFDVFDVPYLIFLVLGGLALGFIPPGRARPRPRRLEARDINSGAGQDTEALC